MGLWRPSKELLKGCLLAAFFVFSVQQQSNAQQDYKGKVLDAKTGEPIPYVNIGIVNMGIGTVSDEEGIFHLTFGRNRPDDEEVILFSSLGYGTLEILVKDFPLVYNEYPEFKMRPAAVALNEVVVSNKGERFIPDGLGYRNYGEQAYGYWKDNVALGGELATKIAAKKGLRRLDRFQFEVFYNPSDSLLLRVNLYDDDGLAGKPKTNLNTSNKNILVTIKKDDKVVWVDLKPFDIYVKDDFIVSLELLKVYGEAELGLIVAASLYQYGSFRKYSSQDKWERITDQNMAYYLETSLMVSESVAKRFEKKEAKKKQKQSFVTGFAIEKGKMLPNVKVQNQRTKEEVLTNEKGRYQIAARKNDALFFSKSGYQTMMVKVTDKPTANIIMKVGD